MTDRININGTWYRKEDPKENIDLILSKSIVTENKDIFIQATILLDEYGYKEKDTLFVEIKLKNTEDKYDWDSPNWLAKLQNRGKKEIEEAMEDIPKGDLEVLLNVLDKAKELDWL